ncbi:hypothetical protein WMY93_007795 [Mugilogobius chulae]|uniref:Uncharacterized protein n=1 Tax=Mugilogobius chulae TaxID=88201 RepID=A0AAW0PN11_9GOBI
MTACVPFTIEHLTLVCLSVRFWFGIEPKTPCSRKRKACEMEFETSEAKKPRCSRDKTPKLSRKRGASCLHWKEWPNQEVAIKHIRRKSVDFVSQIIGDELYTIPYEVLLMIKAAQMQRSD